MEAPARWEPRAGGSASLPATAPSILWADLAVLRVRPTLGGGQLSLQTELRPLPTDHTAAFSEASLGCGPQDLEAGK